jgi:CRISPR-associated protein Cas2
MWEELDDEIYEEKKYVVLIIYDISDNKQRLKISKYLSAYGIRVQKSAFEARLSKRLFENLVKGLNIRLKPEDNVRIYRLQGYEEIKVFGSKNYISDEEVIII